MRYSRRDKHLADRKRAKLTHQFGTCEDDKGKICYPTLRRARAEARTRTKQYDAYPCGDCCSWHLTSSYTCLPPTKSFVCKGCNLKYSASGPNDEFCSTGCFRKHLRGRA